MMMMRALAVYFWLVFCSLVGASTWEKVGEEAGDTALVLRVTDSATGQALPFRATVKTSDGQYADGSGRGTYSDGRFFAEGETRCMVPPGEVSIEIGAGPEYRVASFGYVAESGKVATWAVALERWIDLSERGWYSGDNHVHSKHDQHVPIQTDLSYAALQARAQGLHFITEAGSNVSYDQLESLSTPTFAIRHCGEIRPGPYVGHFNPAGLHQPLPEDLYEKLIQQPLPAQALYPEIRKRGGIVIHTHPLMPRHQLHWMGASQAWSDAVLQDMADLFDVDANHTERLWFALLNLGNRIGVSGHTDAALGRKKTPSPGDSRVYCRAERVDYDHFVESMGQGRTMATNGGPIFGLFSVEDQYLPGDRMAWQDTVQAKLEVHSLAPVASAAIYQNGQRVAAFNAEKRSGALTFEQQISIPADRDSWLVARTQDVNGKWCLTSPIYIAAKEKQAPPAASSVLFQICNATRFATLSRDYFAHILTTVRAPETLKSVSLYRDGERVRSFSPGDGDRMPSDGKIPTSGMWGDYEEGWIWHTAGDAGHHFQGDIPIVEAGWYRVVIETDSGRQIRSSEVHFDASIPRSQSLSVAKLQGLDTELNLWGYGEDIELEKLHPKLNPGSWWYPKEIYWRVQTKFGDSDNTLGWPVEQPVERFRE